MYFIYILTNYQRTTLYVGVTNDLCPRLGEHRTPDVGSGAFSTRYNCHHLVYFETFDSIRKAIAREKEIKKWRREKKDKLIASKNPNWDFWNDLIC